MKLCIGTIRDSNYSISKYRIIDTDNRTVGDYTEEQLLKLKDIRNIDISDGRIVHTEGEINNYPYIYNGTEYNRMPIVVDKGDKNITIAALDGRVVTLPLLDVISKIKIFANALLDGNNLKYKNTKKAKAASDILSIVMKADTVDIDTSTFNIADTYKKFGVSDDVFKSPSEIFIGDKQSSSTNNNSVIDKSAYRFEIVTIDDRVELRKYIGEEYKGIVEIPDNVTHICKEAFKYAEASEVIMGDNVVYLGEYAFTRSHIKKVKLSSKVTAIPLGCFYWSWLEEIDLTHITSIDNLAFCRSNIEQVILEGAVVQIGYEAFKDCKNLKLFKHNKTIKKIRHHAFENCMMLSEFDFESVTTIEQYAFLKTGITTATINGEVNYLQTGTFTGNIEEIIILDGLHKIAADSVSNITNKPIKWTVPKSATNIEKGAFKKQDTVTCYRASVAASSAILADAAIIYLDDFDKNSIPAVIRKANMIDASVEDILKKTLSQIVEKEDFQTEYNIDESKVQRADIPKSILDLIDDEDFITNKYASDEDIANERVKFKVILEHLSKVAKFDITPFSSVVLELTDTFSLEKKDDKLECIYNDGVSSVYRIKYVDNKFASINSSFIVAKTYDTLRYICMDNKYTDMICESVEVQDLSALLKILRPGDTIGLNNIISGVKYDEIKHESDKTIEITRNGRKIKRKLIMNMYQALKYSAVTLRIDSNYIVIILPANNTIIKCASLGRTVWLNEKEETYKSVQCTIESIEEINNNTIFDYESTSKISNPGTLLKRFKVLQKSQYDSYKEKYSHIYKAEQSMYKHAGDYAYVNGMKKVEDLDLEFMLTLFKTSLFEERQDSWLEGSIGKTIVPDVQSEFSLADGATVYQYRTVRKTALRNKLMSGGDRKLYIFELVDASGIRIGIYISMYDIVSLVNMCIEINNQSNRENKQIFKNKDTFDIVDWEDVIEIAPMCRDSTINYKEAPSRFILAVYKPNGLYCIGLKIERNKLYRFIPIIQVGELEVALEFVEYSNKLGINTPSMKYLYEGSIGILNYYVTKVLGIPDYTTRIHTARYLGLLKARELCINGVSDITDYNNIGLPEVLKRCMGYNIDDNIYKLPEQSTIMHRTKIDLNSIDDIDESDYDEDFDISEEDLDEI